MEGSSDVCPDCIAIDKEIWKLYHEILREKPLWNAYRALEKLKAPGV